MDIQVLGAHNCESADSKLVSLLIDDVLALDAGGLTASLSFADQQKLKALLLTHQHYDHIRDVPALAMNLYLRNAAINVYSIQPVYDALASRFLDGVLYPRFLERPEGKPTLRFTVIEPHKVWHIEDYAVLAVPVAHSVPAVGYQVTSPDGKKLFYTGDTGPGLADCWEYVSPQILIIEVTAPSQYDEFGKKSKHLTTNLLREELTIFQKRKGYLPQVVAVHVNPAQEEEIAKEIAAIAGQLGSPIILAHEGMRLHL